MWSFNIFKIFIRFFCPSTSVTPVLIGLYLRSHIILESNSYVRDSILPWITIFSSCPFYYSLYFHCVIFSVWLLLLKLDWSFPLISTLVILLETPLGLIRSSVDVFLGLVPTLPTSWHQHLVGLSSQILFTMTPTYLISRTGGSSSDVWIWCTNGATVGSSSIFPLIVVFFCSLFPDKDYIITIKKNCDGVFLWSFRWNQNWYSWRI